ncbi:MAG: energy transducer TonB [Ferruginibacter sp.]
MSSNNVFKFMLPAAILASVFTISCNNNDTTDDSTTTTKMDTMTVMPADTMHMTMDTTHMMADTAKADNTTVKQPTSGMATPNPAKKGMKGKVSISTTPVKNMDSKMEADNKGVYSNVEVLPSYPGGNKGLQKFFDDNLQYPADASNDGVEGTVNVSFVVDETGKLTAPKVEGDNLGYGLEAEALRVINKMPNWNPGKLKGKNVRTRFNLPVRFLLY